LVYKVINATLALQEHILMAKLAQHVQAPVIHVPVILFAKLVKADTAYKAINAVPVLQELI